MKMVKDVWILLSSKLRDKSLGLILGAAFSIAVLIILVMYFYSNILGNTNGQFVYGLDDPYIHLTIAKNFVEHGVWGLSPSVPTSSSSSPLWTLLLALIYSVTGILDITPFILNVLFAIGVTLLLFSIISKFYESPIAVTAWVNIIIYGAYLPRMIFMGMEHILHVLLLLIIVKKLINYYQETQSLGFYFWIVLFMANTVRYESAIFTVLLAVYFFAMSEKKLFGYTLISLFSSFLVTGVLSVYAGGWFLPNSVFLRRTVFEISWVLPLTLLNNFYLTLQSQYQFPLLLTSLIAIISVIKTAGSRYANIFLLICALTIGTAMIHSMIGMMVLRYFFYLNVLLLLAFVFGISYLLREKVIDISISFDFHGGVKLVAFFVLTMGLVWNGMMANRRTIKASTNIYDQQTQTSDFIKDYYNFSTLAINDIGVISRYTDCKIVDVAGLADNKIARHINDGKLDSKILKERLRESNTDVMILPEVLVNSLDTAKLNWILVGSWKIANNVVCASDRIHFFAPDQAKAQKLATNLEKFRNRLPRSVTVEY